MPDGTMMRGPVSRGKMPAGAIPSTIPWSRYRKRFAWSPITSRKIISAPN
jgi:hypothetical protein